MKCIFDSLPSAVVIFTCEVEAKLKYMNSKFEELLKQVGVEEEDKATLQSLKMLKDPEDGQKVYSLQDIEDNIEKLEGRFFETRRIRVSNSYVTRGGEDKGKKMIVQVKLQQIVFEGQLCELIMLEDVSTLFELTKEKQIKAEMKESFACIQHEMKNCVTFILTFADLLLRDCLDSQLQFLEPLKEAAKLLMFTMSDWLDNTQLENNAFIPTLSNFKIVEAIQEITKMCSTMLGNKNVELRC